VHPCRPPIPHAKATATALDELCLRKARYAIVSMCIGGGMGAAGLFEAIHRATEREASLRAGRREREAGCSGDGAARFGFVQAAPGAPAAA
jgi:hypothetical protein